MPNTSTATVLRTACQLANYYGLTPHDHPQLTDTHGRLDPIAAVFRAVTGKTPHCFTNDIDQALLLIRTNETVMDALAWISAVLPTRSNTDPELTDDNGHQPEDHIEHIASWYATTDFYLQRCPNLCDVIGTFQRAAQTAETLPDIPQFRPEHIPA
ncbi:hypothetical protein [Streptomyces sp. NPDC059076]|uniref:hypothetical protein n=1 Tax=unclassified Streptomyces TaxID=2593676 RepID=UPI0036917637